MRRQRESIALCPATSPPSGTTAPPRDSRRIVAGPAIAIDDAARGQALAGRLATSTLPTAMLAVEPSKTIEWSMPGTPTDQTLAPKNRSNCHAPRRRPHPVPLSRWS
jgi:hypothetical protein